MKIIEAEENWLKFDTGDTITCDYQQECCEENYADFSQLDDIAKAYDFGEELLFEKCDCDGGFRFGDKRRMYWVPCYSVQNGYYSCKLDVYWNGKLVLEAADCDYILK